MSTATKPKHIGRNISRIRELRGMKQESLAVAIGVSQQSVSNIEGSENVDDEKLNAIAEVLGVSVDAIKNYSDEGVINYFNSFNDHSINQGPIGAQNICNFNPLDKLIDAYEENKKLYERLLQADKDKIEYLENFLKDK
ncbi:helix-turn-helix transcriptional regulator [Flavobacterium psychroterrae]|uniref:Helix-turn-helix transcriptional regulator n=1 Tax=Flavobacterium psychroterrae TaxID=2133767 RepID=A0ABS5P6L9_9FLAO|nr:helix-turn-helix transcriptional regulator [Flavobacterium psychroterrae]MBS7229924.1 helix-turn-helix transcriptional regulator [Flavobacterium psychroterrae]